MHIMSARFVVETMGERRKRTDLIVSDVDAYFDATDDYDMRRYDTMDILIGLVTRHGCIRIDNNGNHSKWYYLHRSTRYYKSLQLTAWDERGPIFDERIGSTRDLTRSSLPDDMRVTVDLDMTWI